MQTNSLFVAAATASIDCLADVKDLPAAPVELDLMTLRLVAGGLPRSGWGSTPEVAVTSETDLPRAGW